MLDTEFQEPLPFVCGSRQPHNLQLMGDLNPDTDASVHHNHLALNEVAQGTGQKQHGVRNVGGLQHSIADKNLFSHRRQHACGSRQCLNGGCFDNAGHDGVEVHSRLPEFKRQMTYETFQRGFRRSYESVICNPSD